MAALGGKEKTDLQPLSPLSCSVAVESGCRCALAMRVCHVLMCVSSWSCRCRCTCGRGTLQLSPRTGHFRVTGRQGACRSPARDGGPICDMRRNKTKGAGVVCSFLFSWDKLGFGFPTYAMDGKILEAFVPSMLNLCGCSHVVIIECEISYPHQSLVVWGQILPVSIHIYVHIYICTYIYMRARKTTVHTPYTHTHTHTHYVYII